MQIESVDTKAGVCNLRRAVEDDLDPCPSLVLLPGCD